MNTSSTKVLVLLFLLIQCTSIFLFGVPQMQKNQVHALNSFTQAYLTLGNSRLSHLSLLSAASSANATSFTIGTTDSTHTDADTNDLFPGDTICFNNPYHATAFNGCASQLTYSVNNIGSTTNFLTSANVANAMTASTAVVATQSGVLTVSFKPSNNFSSGDTLVLTIPSTATASRYQDGIPDVDGFDSAALPTDLLAGTGCTSNACFTATGFTVSAVAAVYATGSHTITLTLSGTGLTSGNSYSFTLGHTSNAALRFLNPAPCNVAGCGGVHARGTSDKYGFQLQAKQGSVVVNQSTLRANPNDGVLVSATVPESLTFIVAGLSSSTTHCNVSTSVTTQAYSVPFGTLTNSDTFYNAAQNLEVRTNANSGYFVTTQESNQMGRSSNPGFPSDVCPNTSPSAGNYTFTSTNYCIRDTTCNGSVCSESTSQDWTSASGFPGLGYSLANVTNTPASFLYNESSRTFSAKQFADTNTVSGNETAQNIMTGTGPTSSDKADVCFRLTVPADQPAAYYYNVVTYIATAKF